MNNKFKTHLLELTTKENEVIKTKIDLIVSVSDKFAFNLMKTNKYKKVKLTLIQ